MIYAIASIKDVHTFAYIRQEMRAHDFSLIFLFPDTWSCRPVIRMPVCLMELVFELLHLPADCLIQNFGILFGHQERAVPQHLRD